MNEEEDSIEAAEALLQSCCRGENTSRHAQRIRELRTLYRRSVDGVTSSTTSSTNGFSEDGNESNNVPSVETIPHAATLAPSNKRRCTRRDRSKHEDNSSSASINANTSMSNNISTSICCFPSSSSSSSSGAGLSGGNGEGTDGKKLSLEPYVILGNINVTQLAANILEQNGGAAHFETIVAVALGEREVRACPEATPEALRAALSQALAGSVQFIRGFRAAEGETWILSTESIGFASDGSDDEDDAFPRAIPDCRADASALDPFLFARTPLSSPQLAADIRYDSISGAIHRILEEQADATSGSNAGAAHEDDIVEVMVESWVRPSRTMTDSDVRDAVGIALRTSPLFHECQANPRFWTLSEACKNLPRRWRRGSTKHHQSQFTEEQEEDQSQQQQQQQQEQQEQEQDQQTSSSLSEHDVGTDSKQALSTLVSASTAASIASLSCCHCGATIPSRGPNARWKRGVKPGTVMCLLCSAGRPKSVTCPVCGTMYKHDDPWSYGSSKTRRDALMAATAMHEYDGSFANEFSSDEDSTAGDWIMCEDCHRWVMVKCDESIQDLNVFSDDNPDHVRYSCPLCRQKHGNMYGKSSQDSEGSGEAIIESVLTSLTHKFDELVAGARQAATDSHGRHTAVFHGDDLAEFQANLLKRCEGSLRRVLKERAALIEKSNNDLLTQRAEIEQDFSHQFRDRIDHPHNNGH